MGSTKHEKSFVNFDKGYETNIIGLKGIIYFGVGLFLLVVITFGLMWYLERVMEQQADDRDKTEINPMTQNLKKEDRLPPEPRLQTAPGFGVGEGQDRVNLELGAPQSEYWELEKRWKKMEKDGQSDPNTGTVITLPMTEAKEKLLQENVKAKTDATAQKQFEDSRKFASYANGGRTAMDVRR